MSAIAPVEDEDITMTDSNKNKSSGKFLFVIDRSGSMAGRRMETAKNSLEYFLKSLPEFSKFNICSFGSTYQLMYPNFVNSNDNTINEALITIRKFKADLGGTELHTPFNRILEEWQKEIKSLKEKKEIIRVFVLTDGSIDNPDNFLLSLKKNIDFFRENDIDLTISSLGIGSGCSDYLVRGIADNGKGDAEFALNNEDMIEKVVYLLEYSLKKKLRNFKIFFEDNQNANNSLLINSDVGGEFNIAVKSFNKTIEFFSKVEFNEETLKKFEDQNLIISYIDVDDKEENITISLKDAIVNDDDTIFKLWVNNKVDKFYEDSNARFREGNSYQLEKENLTKISIKYSCLNRNTSLFMILKEKNIQKNNQFDKKKFVSMVNSDLDYLNNNCESPKSYSNLFGGDVKKNKSKQRNLFSSQSNFPQSSGSGLFASQQNFPQPSGLFGNQQNFAQPPSIFQSNTNSLFGNKTESRFIEKKKGDKLKYHEVKKSINQNNLFENVAEKKSIKQNTLFENIVEKTSSLFSVFSNKKQKKIKKVEKENICCEIEKEEQDDDFMNVNYNLKMNRNKNMDEDEDMSMKMNMEMDMDMDMNEINPQHENIEMKSEVLNQNINMNDMVNKSSSNRLQKRESKIADNKKEEKKANFSLEDIEKEILKSQNFNGSWNENNLLDMIINNKNWIEISNNFNNKFSDRIKKENENNFIFTLYVLNFIYYEIKDIKVLNKLKLIISKGEKYVGKNSEKIDLYSEEVKNIFRF
jgi:hypothetical protein